MYEVDSKDQVIEIKQISQSSIGAPMPMVLAGEDDVFLIYYLENPPNDWDGTTVRVVGLYTENEPVAIVSFKQCYAHMFGPPNDEAFSGHPLESRGLKPYSAFEVRNSSWIRKLEQMNSVHTHHDKLRFMKNKKHFIFVFHDTTFECIAEGYIFKINKASVRGMISYLSDLTR